MPVLSVRGHHVADCGCIGAGSICQLVHSCIAAATSQATTEWYTLGVKAKADVNTLWETERRGGVGRDAGGMHRLPDTWFSASFLGLAWCWSVRRHLAAATPLGPPVRGNSCDGSHTECRAITAVGAS
jgi:hypothetical protein